MPPPPRVNEIAAIGFDRGADDYERGRPGYPPEAVRRLGDEIGIAAGQTIVDLAAGTGKLTRELVAELPAEVIAVEPVAGMRSELERAVPGVRVLDGTAEQIPLDDGAVHAVFVAQAFHWFRVPEAAAEIARVLDDGGALAIVRNGWNEGRTPWDGELRALIRERADRPHGHDRNWREALEATGRFQMPLHEWTVPNPVIGDIQTLRHRVASMSYIATLDARQRETLLDDVQALLQRHGVRPGARLEIPTRTRVLWARKRG